ncbi:hypothetical protein LPJ61_001952, partial [Coemansia biformis]
MMNGTAFVDKTAALADVMGENVPMVIAGLYPRRMGKTSFLDALNGFLAVVSDISCNKRMEAFKECAIYQDNRECFDKHFARYAVFKLDLKSVDQAAAQLRKAVVRAARGHIRFLRNLLGGGVVDISARDRGTIMANVHRYREDITRIINSFKFLDELRDVNATHLVDIGALLPELMEVFYWLFGRGSVLIVDEYDAPFMNILCGVADVNLRTMLQREYGHFLSASLKVGGKNVWVWLYLDQRA